MPVEAQAALIVFAILAGISALVRVYGTAQRLRGHRLLGDATRIREAHGVTVRAFLTGIPARVGLNPRKRNRTRGDLLLTADRLLLSTTRGVLVDLGPDHGRRFTSVRCTGPQRLVMEGDLPRPDGAMGHYRYELVVDDAEGWAEALQAFVREGDEQARFALKPPEPS